MAGGTGGHVFPALAVARELQAQGAEVTWLGTQKGLEADVIPKNGIAIDWITITGVRGKGVLGWVMAPLRIWQAMKQAEKIFHARQPNVVLGMGGFVTGPGGLAAKVMGIPLVIHEQNSIAGMTNRWLAKIATRILTAFPDVLTKYLPTENVGNPLRGEVTQLPPPEARMQNRHGALRLLVVGGSLGAAALNKVVPEALSSLSPKERPDVWHQTGKKNFDETLDSYRQAGVGAKVVPFIDNMAEAYAWADLIICRAGALTISEIACVGIPSILVPYPHAVDDHQTTNAKLLVDAGAAYCVQQKDLDAAQLAQYIREFNEDRAYLLSMAKAARQLGRPDATKRVAEICLEVAHV
jgi:UDP-N-acetylglucosamine--N-acetylmuramyl-(pentapeptide) pyrophosphoryl-undecaprenol N-acetylglucosamine transferase